MCERYRKILLAVYTVLDQIRKLAISIAPFYRSVITRNRPPLFFGSLVCMDELRLGHMEIIPNKVQYNWGRKSFDDAIYNRVDECWSNLSPKIKIILN